MKQLMCLALCAITLLGADAPATTPAPAGSAAATASPAADRLYDDPGMHFEGPAGWNRVPVDAGTGSAGGFVPLVLFTMAPGKYEQKSLIIVASRFSGSLEEFESNTESEMRSTSDDAFVHKKVRVIMPNGMPAYWLNITRGGEAGKMYQTYRYAIVDGKRGILASVNARLGDVREEQARAWLSGLRVVLYPNGR